MLDAIKRAIIVIIGVILQFGFSILLRFFFKEHIMFVGVIYWLIGVLIVLWIIKNSTRLSNDLPFIILTLLFPIFGAILLITVGKSYIKNKLLRQIIKKEKEYQMYYVEDELVKKEIYDKNLDQLKFIMDYAKYPVSKNNDITYYKSGEEFYPEFLSELKKAEKFIFMEYFIINKGKMWDGILNILKEKASNGVEVRIIYDDMGSLGMLKANYAEELSGYNIKCISFNKLSPFKGIFMNNRDHRKMTIIDGKVAFSGGVNISDEYININSKLGVWKDNGIKIEGDAVFNFTVMFCSLWNANIKEDEDLLKFKYDFSNKKCNNGYVLPYGISPIYKPFVAEDVYINIINSAKKYVYIMTPYLIIDTDMQNTLVRAAKRGVDVKIVVPGVPDKKIVYTQTSSFFPYLTKNGVKICKYNDGFVHSKIFVSDDTKAVVGTINMDYRSLYLHFENAIYMENVKEIKNIKKDVLDTLDNCTILTKKNVKVGFFKGIWQSILRLFAPLF